MVFGRSGRPVIEVTHKGEKTQFTLEEISAMALGEIRKPLGLTSARRSPTPSSLSPSIATPLSFRTSVPSPVSTSSPISNQFTAAADAYDLNKKNTRGADDCHLVAYDLGRETFVASFLPFDDGAFEVLATGSDTHLRQPHHRVHDQAARGKGRYRRFKNYHTLGKLKRQVEKAKRTVSCQVFTKLEIASFEGGTDFSGTIATSSRNSTTSSSARLSSPSSRCRRTPA